MKTATEIQFVSVGKLIPYVNNAWTHSPEQLTKLCLSLREFGFVNQVIIDRDLNVEKVYVVQDGEKISYSELVEVVEVQ